MTKDEYLEVSNLKKQVNTQDQMINKLSNTLNRVMVELGMIRREMSKVRSNKDWNERK